MKNSEKKEQTILNLVFKLLSHLSDKKRLAIVILVFFMFLSSVLEIFSIGLVIPFITILFKTELSSTNQYLSFILEFKEIFGIHNNSIFITFLFILAIFISSVLRFFLIYFQGRLSLSIATQLTSEVYLKTLFQPYESHKNINSGEILAATSKASVLDSSILMPLANLIYTSFFILIILGSGVFINPTVAISILSIFIFFYLIVYKLHSYSISYFSKQSTKNANLLIKNLNEGLGSIRDIIIDQLQYFYHDIYKQIFFRQKKAEFKILLVTSAPKFILESVLVSSIAIIACYISLYKNYNFINILPFIAFLVLMIQRLMPIFQISYSSIVSIMSNKHYLLDTLYFLNLKNHVTANPNTKISFKNKITLNNIFFQYKLTKKYILNDVSFSIKKGSIIGIVGASGSGKSTLLDLIMGLITPKSGRIKIDNTLINSETLPLLRSKISHVPQNIYLSDSTLAENIAFGIKKEKISLSKLEAACKNADILDFVNSLPEKFNTIVGERGARLSGGQRQRIGIARALYKKSEILIFDEATNALDIKTEKQIISTVAKLKNIYTIILVTHKLDILESCTSIYELKNGNLRKINN